MQGADLAVAATLAAAGTGFWLYLYRNPIGRPLFGVGSDTLPAALALVIAGLSLALVIALSIRRRPAPAVGRGDAENGVQGSLRLLALVVLCLAFCIGLRQVGFLISGGALVLGAALLFGKRQVVALSLMTFAVPFVVTLFFEKAMAIYLPAGRLFQ
jgi:hypothetical protein